MNDKSSLNHQNGIVFRDLETLLKKSFDDENVKVVDYKISRLVSIEESYGSTVLKIDAKITGKNGNKNEQYLYLVAKIINNSSDRPYFDWPKVFVKEVYMYSELMSVYKKLEAEVGIKDVIDVLPKYIGHRYSLDYSSDHLDVDNSVILIENLIPKNFYTCDRLKGMNKEHSIKALSTLARYHALGIALKRKKPEIFKRALEHARIVGLDYSQILEGLDVIIKNSFDDERFLKYRNLINTAFKTYKNNVLHPKDPEEPWATITHGDFWIKNVLFHCNEQGKIDEVKLIDFQNYSYNSPLKDLPQYFYMNVNSLTLKNHLDELIDLYYDSLIGHLKLLNIDTKEYNRKSFDNELKKQAFGEFAKIVLFLKFLVQEIKNKYEDDCKELMLSVFKSECTQAYRDKVLDLICLYEKKGWI